MRKLLSILMVFTFLLISAAGCAKAPSRADIPPVKESAERGISLSNVLEYSDAQLEEIEAFFIENVLVDMPYEYEFYNASELSFETFENRNGVVIVERCIGFVTNKITGDGKILNVYNEDYSYISYRPTDQKYSDGTVFVTYMVYNPENNDIVERYDFVLCRKWED